MRMTVLQTLYGRLVLVLLCMLCLFGILFFVLLRYSAQLYQQEVTQQLNSGIAEHVTADLPLLENGAANQATLKFLFHQLMVINPSIEVYLLDPQGRILEYSAPAEKIKRQQVDLQAIQTFIDGKAYYPLTGDDPRSLTGQKVFSAAPIKNGDVVQGYLYVILAGEQYQTIAQMLQGSYITRVTGWAALGGLLIILVFGLLLFLIMTHRLRRLSRTMHDYACTLTGQHGRDHVQAHHSGDEIGQLEKGFQVMADRISQQVEALQRNDAMRRELIANVSHDLRTPLTTLHGSLETLLLKGEQLDATEQQVYLKTAFEHSKRLSRLIGELFDLAKLDSCEVVLRTEPFSLAELVQDVVQKFHLRAEEQKIHLEVDFDRGLPFAYGDIGMLQRVLENLLDNALRHTPSGGRVIVSLARTGDKLEVRVADSGVGIPKEALPHIFERFYRVQKSREDGVAHAGLGLAISKRILELHGSSIETQSEINRGTCFTFLLPMQGMARA